MAFALSSLLVSLFSIHDIIWVYINIVVYKPRIHEPIKKTDLLNVGQESKVGASQKRASP